MMSLKAFHLFFITCSTALAIGFGLWAVRDYSSGDGGRASLAYAIGSFALVPVLGVYGVWFWRKLNKAGI